MKIAVVILNWNGINFLKQFLPSVINNSSQAKIYVADNASTDGSVDYIKSLPGITSILFPSNFGFCKGYNEALKQIDSDYFILLNSDVEVTPGWIDPVIGFMEQNKEAAACQPKILSYHSKNHFEYAGAAGGFIDLLGYPFCRGRVFDTLEKDEGQYNDKEEIFWASGACLFIRSEIFYKHGGFDDDLFAHMEEIDLCWRIKSHGGKIFSIPDSVVFHVGGGTLQSSSARKTYLNFRNNLHLILKNYPSPMVLPVFLIRLILDGVAGIKFFLSQGPGHCLAIIKAHYYIYSHLAKIIRKRKSLNKMNYQRFKSAPGVLPANVVFLYYFKKLKFFSAIRNKN
ncbi:MAG: glycosyltransferase family 2 protein [Cytophagaceae bacterium]